MYLPRVVTFGKIKVFRLGAMCLVFTTFVLVLCRHSSAPTKPSMYEYTEGRTSEWRDWYNASKAVHRSDELTYLSWLADTHGLTKEIPWFARRVQTKFSSWTTTRPSMTDVGTKFLGDFARIRLRDEKPQLRVEKATKLVAVRSARPEEVDASAILFGISTSYQRVVYANYALLRDWQRWLTDGKGTSNGACLMLTLRGAGKKEVDDIASVARTVGIDVVVQASEGPFDAAERYVKLVELLKRRNAALAAEGRPRRYLVLADDDVFFPSMATLLRKLEKFSSSKEFYIGMPSERSDWVLEGNATMTHGGGAVVMTPPMVNRLDGLSCLGRVKRGEDVGDRWDMTLYNCIAQNTDMALHVLPSFYNPVEEDLYGEQGVISEGYSGGLPALALHHHRNWHRFEAGKGHLVTAVCGEDCFLQRFRFKDNWILINGYTISHYPDGVDALPLRKDSKLLAHQYRETRKTIISDKLLIEKTARPDDLKVVAWRGVKKTWRLLDSAMRENGEVWQAYVNRRGGGNSFDDRLPGDTIHSEPEKVDVDSVIVLIWEP